MDKSLASELLSKTASRKAIADNAQSSYAGLGSKTFWDRFFRDKEAEGKVSESYRVEYTNIRKHLLPFLELLLTSKPSEEKNAAAASRRKAIVLGCGNSVLSEQLTKDIPEVVSIDYCESVIQQMKEKYSLRRDMAFQLMNVTDLKFPDGSFDLAFDKGTLDALYCAAVEEDVKKMIDNVYRILRPAGGLYCIVGAAKTDKIKKLVMKEEYKWEWNCGSLENEDVHVIVLKRFQ